MFHNLYGEITKNKNALMLIFVFIYICSLISVFIGKVFIFSTILTILLIFFIIKKLFTLKFLLLATFVFYFGILNTSIRLKETDVLLNIAPRNGTIYGKIISIPQTKNGENIKFFLKADKFEYDETSVNLKDEKVLISISNNYKFNLYDYYKIRGRLSIPFKSSNPSQFDYADYLNNYGCYSVLYAHNPYDMRNLDIPPFEKINISFTKKEKVLRAINNYRETIITKHSQYMKSPNLEILGGIIFGDDAISPPEDIRQSFINSGLLHILAASGMNVAFIFAFFFFLFNIFRIPYKINTSLCIGAVVTYVFMTGLGASVIRAALMLIFVLIGKLIDRDAHSISLLSFVAFIMLVYNPMYLNNVGFQLSFIVTLGILIMMPILIKSKNRIISWLLGSLFVPIIAQLWVIPIQIYYFNNISLYSVFANIMSVPFVEIVSPCGFISALLAGIPQISDFVCQNFDKILNPLITIIVKTSNFWGSLPYSNLETMHPNFLQIILYYSILINLSALFIKDIREKYFNILKTSIPILVIILLISFIRFPNHNLEVTAFDVGNADAFFIKTPENKYFMIDTGKSGYNGGKSQAEFVIVKFFKDNGIKNLDGIIVTHFDNDHCGGTVDLIKHLKVNNIYVNSTNHKSNQAAEIYKTAKENNVNIIKAKNEQVVFNQDGLKITNFVAENSPGIGDNENSINTLLKYNNFTMLFTGDSGIDTFYKISKYIPKNITVYKVGHHGAQGVVNKEMANYLNPKYSLVSTGENKFGHPSAYTLGILNHSKILRTDSSGAIKFVVNKDKHQIYIYNNSSKKYSKLTND